MKLLLLLHGEIVVGLMASFLLALIVFPVAAFWLWKRPPRTPALSAVVYLLAAFVICVMAVALDKDYLLMLAAAFSFPWSFLLILLSTVLEVDFGGSLLFLGVIINAFLIYKVGKASKNRAEQHSSQ
jgi:Cu/Ag efflux pump CusA